MLPKFQVGDRVVRIKGNWIGERATVVSVGAGGVHIILDNKTIRGDRPYVAGRNFIELIDRYDDLDID